MKGRKEKQERKGGRKKERDRSKFTVECHLINANKITDLKPFYNHSNNWFRQKLSINGNTMSKSLMRNRILMSLEVFPVFKGKIFIL